MNIKSKGLYENKRTLKVINIIYDNTTFFFIEALQGSDNQLAQPFRIAQAIRNKRHDFGIIRVGSALTVGSSE